MLSTVGSVPAGISPQSVQYIIYTCQYYRTRVYSTKAFIRLCRGSPRCGGSVYNVISPAVFIFFFFFTSTSNRFTPDISVYRPFIWRTGHKKKHNMLPCYYVYIVPVQPFSIPFMLREPPTHPPYHPDSVDCLVSEI